MIQVTLKGVLRLSVTKTQIEQTKMIPWKRKKLIFCKIDHLSGILYIAYHLYILSKNQVYELFGLVSYISPAVDVYIKWWNIIK